jgi:hypothetical protein
VIQSSVSRLPISLVLIVGCLSAGSFDLCNVRELASSHPAPITVDGVILKRRICWCSQQWAPSQFLLLYGRHGAESSDAWPLRWPRNCPRKFITVFTAVHKLALPRWGWMQSFLSSVALKSILMFPSQLRLLYSGLFPSGFSATVGAMTVCMWNLMNLHTFWICLSEIFICYLKNLNFIYGSQVKKYIRHVYLFYSLSLQWQISV